MQPHHPFLGPTAEEKFSSFNGNVESRKSALGKSANQNESLHVWEALQNNNISIGTVARAYRESLEEVLPHVKRLVDQIEGKTVVTSDHGNLLGEKPHWINFPKKSRYGHPDFSTSEPLVKVPWLEMPFENRRKIKKDQPKHDSLSDTELADEDNDVSERLEALGYKE
ncbi:hypothetical protein ACFFQF_30560 [Haladaptatus pallidirubidus]|uniref:Uncharacterized protein n=2 Tax=Haladaptatus pallidirubidus TaxID=1008152 RepID=A0AAV3UHX6_9EURY